MLRWSRDKDREKTSRGAADSETGMFRSHARAVRPLDEPRAARDAVAPGEGTATLEDVLLSEGTVTADELKAAQDVQAKAGGFLGQILIDLGYIDANSLTSFLAKHCKIPHLSLLDYLIDESQVKLVPEEICLKYRLLPIDRLGRNLTVAMVNPLDTEALEEVRKACPELRVKPILCEYSHYQAVARRLFKVDEVQREVSMDTLGLAAASSAHAPPEASPPPVKPAAAPAPAPQSATAPQESALEPLGASAAASPTTEKPKTQSQPLQTPPPSPKATPPRPTEPAPPRAASEASVERPAPPSPIAGEPTRPTAAEGEAAPADRSFDDEAVLEAFFGVASEEGIENDSPGRGEKESGPGTPSVLQEMVAIMGDSMRDTYGMLARKLALFSGLSSEQVAKIFAKGITAEFDEGQTIFREGDKGEDLYVILGGTVSIVQHSAEVVRLSAGDAFGETAMFTDNPRNATAIAVETSSFLVLNEKVIRHVLDKDTALQLLGNLVVSLSQRLQQKSGSH